MSNRLQRLICSNSSVNFSNEILDLIRLAENLKAKKQSHLERSVLEGSKRKQGDEMPFTQPIIETKENNPIDSSYLEQSINTSIHHFRSFSKSYCEQVDDFPRIKEVQQSDQSTIRLNHLQKSSLNSNDTLNGMSADRMRSIGTPQRREDGLSSEKRNEQDIRESIRKQFSKDLIEPTEPPKHQNRRGKPLIKRVIFK